MADIDALNISVEASSDKAASGIDRLIAALDKLEQALDRAEAKSERFGNILASFDRGFKSAASGEGTFVDNSNRVNAVLTQMNNLFNTLSISQFNTNIEQTSIELREVANSGKQSTSILKQLKAGYAAMAVAIEKSKDIVGKYIDATSAYTENLNLFSVSLRENAAAAKLYAEEVQGALGVDSSQFMRQQGILSTLLTGFGVDRGQSAEMSKQMTQLGYDLASYFNIGFDEAFTKIRSGISGELEPLRQLGFDLSQAKLKQIADSMNITASFESMTQAEKSMLRYYAIMTQVTDAHGDMARTITTPANALRVLQAQIDITARSIGAMFIPALQKILPVAIAVVKAIGMIAAEIAGIFGYELPEITAPAVDIFTDITDGAGGASDAIGGVGGATKKLAKQLKLLGFDELNILGDNASAAGGGGGGAGGGGAGGGGGAIDWDKISNVGYDFLDGVTAKADELANKLVPVFKDIWKWVRDIGAGIAVWAIANSLVNNLHKVVDSLRIGSQALTGWEKANRIFAGIAFVVTGTMLSWDFGKALADAEKTGKIAFSDFVKGLLGRLATGVGGALIGSVVGGPVGTVAGFAIGIGVSFIVSALSFDQQARNNRLEEQFHFSEVMADIQEFRASVEEQLDEAITYRLTLQNEKPVEDTLADVEAQFAPVKALIDQIFTLDEKDNKTSAELEVMIGMIDKVNSMNLDGLKVEYDEVTGKVITTRESINGVIKKLEEQAKKTALMNVLVDKYEEQYKAQEKVKGSQETLNEASGRYRGAMMEQERMQRELNGLQYEYVYGSDKSAKSARELSAKIFDLQTALEKQNDVVGEAKKAYDEATLAVDEDTEALDILEGQISDVQTAIADLSGEITNHEVPAIRDTISSASTMAEKMKLAKDAVDKMHSAVKTDLDLVQYKNMADLFERMKKGVEGTEGALDRLARRKWRVDEDWNGGGAVVQAIPATQRASGGFPRNGELYLAREAGNELIGRIGNRNAVANNDQITQGIAQAVYSAVRAANGNTSSPAPVPVIIKIGEREVGEAVIEYHNGVVQRTGESPLMV